MRLRVLPTDEVGTCKSCIHGMVMRTEARIIWGGKSWNAPDIVQLEPDVWTTRTSRKWSQKRFTGEAGGRAIPIYEG